jgi:hypothetical protein
MQSSAHDNLNPSGSGSCFQIHERECKTDDACSVQKIKKECCVVGPANDPGEEKALSGNQLIT